MSNRIANLTNHIRITAEDSDEMRYVKQRLALASLSSQFTLHDEKMKQIILYIVHEMMEGLAGRTSTIRMLPSYVYQVPPHKATGVYYALDLGGTNFRVLRVSLVCGKVVASIESKFRIPEAALHSNAEVLFSFIARSVKAMMADKSPEDLTRRVPLGFTFSFPVEQLSINAGKLIKWTKGFCTTGVEGEEVVGLLQVALKKEQLEVDVVALCNDTVGTLVARYFQDEDAQVGVIIGTGFNAAYFEHACNVTKDTAVVAHGEELTVINMESGNFDSTSCYVLPVTKYDDEMDATTPNAHNQRLEKMVSGLYIGEIARRMLVDMASSGCLPAALGTALAKPWSFEAQSMSAIAADTMPGVQCTRQMIARLTGVDVKDLSDLHMIRNCCQLVRNRAAQLAGALSAAPVLKMRVSGRATVAVDGSVYEKTPSFRKIYQDNITSVLGRESQTTVVSQRDGSGIGAAMICALVANHK